MELTTENLEKLIEWQQAGDRSVEIKIDNPKRLIFTGNPVKIWCFDYGEMEGVHISEIKELPTVEVLRRISLETKKKEIQELEDRLNGMKGAA